jgi:hypothetical protein
MGTFIAPPVVVATAANSLDPIVITFEYPDLTLTNVLSTEQIAEVVCHILK